MSTHFILGDQFVSSHRLQAVPLWSVERVCSQCSETGARRNKREETVFIALGYFARPLDYPERDCLQSSHRWPKLKLCAIIILRNSGYVANIEFVWEYLRSGLGGTDNGKFVIKMTYLASKVYCLFLFAILC